MKEVEPISSHGSSCTGKHITRLVIDIRFSKEQLAKPYGYEGEYDCGTVYDVVDAIEEAGFEVSLVTCVTNAARYVEGTDKNVLHPDMRKSYGEIDG